MSHSINDLTQEDPLRHPLLVEKAREVKADLLQLAREAPEENLDIDELTGGQDLSPATRKILSLTARIQGEAEDAPGYADDSMLRRRNIAADLHGRAKSLRTTYAILTGERIPTYYEDEALTQDMNEISFKTIITPDLHRCHLGPATFGELTTEVPSFPHPGAILDLDGGHSRDIFSLCVTFKDETRKFPFFVDTGGKSSYANRETLRLIMPGIDLSAWTAKSSLCVDIHGVDAYLHLGPPKSSVYEVNLLGTDWLEAGQLALVCDYSKKGRGCALIKGDDTEARTIRQAAPSIFDRYYKAAVP